MINEGLMSIEELSSYLHIPKATIYGWTHARKVPHFKIGKSLRFEKKKIDEWLAAKEIGVSPLLAQSGIEVHH